MMFLSVKKLYLQTLAQTVTFVCFWRGRPNTHVLVSFPKQLQQVLSWWKS